MRSGYQFTTVDENKTVSQEKVELFLGGEGNGVHRPRYDLPMIGRQKPVPYVVGISDRFESPRDSREPAHITRGCSGENFYDHQAFRQGRETIRPQPRHRFLSPSLALFTLAFG